MSYRYLFSNDTHDYYDNEEMILKVPKDIPGGRPDELIEKHGQPAEDDYEVQLWLAQS